MNPAGSGGFVEEALVDSDVSRRRIIDEGAAAAPCGRVSGISERHPFGGAGAARPVRGRRRVLDSPHRPLCTPFAVELVRQGPGQLKSRPRGPCVLS